MSADGNDASTDADKIIRPVGRPSKYDIAFCDRVIDLGCNGASRTEIAFELGVGKTTLQRWEAEFPDFRVAMAHAKEAEQVWWERKGKANLATQGFQSSMWSRSMAARFPDDWRERSDNNTTLNAGGELAGLLAKIATKSVFPKDDNEA